MPNYTLLGAPTYLVPALIRGTKKHVYNGIAKYLKILLRQVAVLHRHFSLKILHIA
jgi:hypothetical protein